MPETLFPTDHPAFARLRGSDGGRAWVERLPALVEEARTTWALRIDPPFLSGSCSWTAPVRGANGEPAVLKIVWPHREARGEAAALRLWDGDGAVRLLAHAPERHTLLLERCLPGTELGAHEGQSAEERLLAACAVLRRLWEAGRRSGGPGLGGIERLTDVAEEWADLVEERAGRLRTCEADTGLFAHGARLLRQLPRTASEPALLHGDFNPGNLLAAARAPWLAIDAKPMLGDPAYDPWPLITQLGDPYAHRLPVTVLRARTALAAEALGLDVARLRAWTLARQVEELLWAWEREQPRNRQEKLRRARVLATVAEA
ncbi:aminoglycoside phosphotransferase family protein [Streptomyces xiaopingdaonensis]|uniref:aminoglycoside phosphotransferase family protein n=1 Tax=Streptomyces xiaopingdaonensis TaxID=1565415 RepID=UPI0002E59019|nr:aminoglycoside phosphotransferase family protein [Streptomyces xiaopingdaonensis]